jgi:pimeloyl-ACP methyl ester carboxylesterase
MQIDPPVTPGAEPDRPAMPVLPTAPAELVDPADEYRLVRELRARAAARDRVSGRPDPTVWLAHSSVEFLQAARTTGEPAAVRERLATAIADLTVTGRRTYDEFRHGISSLELEEKVRARLHAQAVSPAATDAEIQAGMDRALDRAYAVAWALRGSVAQQQALRPGLGWVAVSAEDDMPHRPVNMPAAPYPQYELPVTTPTPGGSLTLTTRFLVACAEPPAVGDAQVPAAPLRHAPSDPIPFIPADHHVLLFLHGHGSGAEEALDVIPHLLEQGRQRGRKYAVISFDLPNNGYSEVFDHERIATAGATTFPFLPTDNTPIATPVLDFVEDFVVAFVDAVEGAAVQQGTPRIKHRIAAIIGGSLGGNLGLRLGRRAPMPDWIRTIVAWSPASVWKAKVKHDPAREGSRVARDRFTREPVDEPASRSNYFQLVYDRSDGLIKAQPNYWYGKSFADAAAYIDQSRWARREIYNQWYRLWHWRLACEQLIFSHVENVVYGDSTTPVRYTLNTVRTLLASGAEDNALFVGIYGATEKLGNAMTATPGRLLLVNDTGHSIHVERPQFFASQITGFLADEPLPAVARGDAAIATLLLEPEPEPVAPPPPRRAPLSSAAAVDLQLL